MIKVRIRKNTDYGPDTLFYEPHVEQSEPRILQSYIIKGNYSSAINSSL